MSAMKKAVSVLLKSNKPMTAAEVAKAAGLKPPTCSAVLWLGTRIGAVVADITANQSTKQSPARFTPLVNKLDDLPENPWHYAPTKGKKGRRGRKAPASVAAGASMLITIAVGDKVIDVTLEEANKIHSDLSRILDRTTRP